MYKKRYDKLDILKLYTGAYATQLYLREISRLSGLPLRTTQNAVSALEKQGVFRSSLRGKNKYFILNRDNIQTKLYLLQSEIDKTLVFLENYPVFRTFLKQAPDMTMVAFGSFAKRTAEKDSDVDLLIVTGGEERPPYHLLPCKAHEIRMSEKTFIKALEKKEPLMQEIEDHHIILTNHSWYVEKMWRHGGT